MGRVADRLSKAAAWDQQVFNSEAMLLSHGERKTALTLNQPQVQL